MRKGVFMQSRTAKMLWIAEIYAYSTDFFPPVHLLKLKYYGTFNLNTQSVNSNTHLMTLKGVFRDKLH